MDQNNGFFQRVYEVTRKVPHGRVTSYGAIARYLGSPGAARMVGWAMNQSSRADPICSCPQGGKPGGIAHREASF